MARDSRRILYLGGHPLFRDAMGVALGRFGFQVAPAVSLRDALDVLREGGVEAAVVDDDALGQAPALEAVSTLVRHHPELRVALLSASRSAVLPADAIRTGAAAYLSKDMPMAELRFAVERILKGQLVVDPVVTRTLLGIMDPAADNGASNGSAKLYLTPVERKVLTLVCEGKANKQVAAAMGLSPLTVKNHIARVRARLGAADRAQAVAVAIRAGLLD
ncbi:MAG: response regulator transcription factor [Actinomycetota bacterium]